ncbi:helix-turn-helix domain-containing protein [Streptomyces sp. NPDC126497]|uniref:helix-turn-helix transcriptional regulator n=1 Tax=Streptomyces sp. NPDC126497 TaxID=3155313 RepID=UPI003323B232
MFVDDTEEVRDRDTAAISAVAALDEPTRRRLYDYVVGRRHPVGRDEAAEALGLARQTAAFHLDRLAAEGLLDVLHVRRSGRSGPGAGRPAKLYRRSAAQIEVSLPDRRYELAGRLLAQAVEESGAGGEPVREVLHRKARELGVRIGADGGTAEAPRVLERYGFEPRRDGESVVLGNCPFHALARDHAQTVCGMNLHLVGGILEGLGDTGFEACPAPEPGRCCVRLDPAA